jgi:valyl-tRNA synthetase
MEPRYDIKEVEARIAERWDEAGVANPDICIAKGVIAPDAEPFAMVLPPPNVTGTLHMGHAAMLAVEDIMVRYARMTGKRTLWIPGTDHAAIATQSRVEKDIAKTEGKSRYDLGREELLRRVHAFAQSSHDTIVRQIRRMGASLDWSREAYTLDESRAFAVRTAFTRLYDMGLIYRGDRVVNWDPKGQTTISDDEIVYEPRTAKLYTFRYGTLADGTKFPIPISTTRPETKFGDTAVAVHPSDERYAQYVGRTFAVDFCGTPISVKVIADESVEKDFGTGALGVTPAHSMIDWEIAQRHDLPLVTIIDERGRMMVANDLVHGKKTAEAREIVATTLRENGLLEKEEEISQNVATAERTGGIIEPLPKLQWFIAVNKPFGPAGKTLKELMRAATESGDVTIMPERFSRIYLNWIDNLRDWCISRQIWFGHRIPVWYNGDDMYVGAEPPADAAADGSSWNQDPDTLDTWFSSGLWPFSTLGWPDPDAPDLKLYFPNAVMETGYDILFFWVARMILMSAALMDGAVPFRHVYLHGLVRDDKGRKMSKSLGNIIDPLTMADTYGADATRLSLVIGAAPGNDIKLSEDRVRGYRNFSTKLWNIARFIDMNRPQGGVAQGVVENNPLIYHRDEMKELAALKDEVTLHIEHFEFHLAGEKIYHYVWHRLADEIIEEQKAALRDGADAERAAAYALLESLLLGSLKLLHPFMPFITEEIWGIFRPGTLLMVAPW